MRRLNLFLVAILALAVGVVVGAVLRNHSAQEEMGQVTARRYAINVAYSTQPFFQDIFGTARKIATAVPGVRFDMGGPSDADSSKQIEEIDALIASKVNGIILFPADPKALAPEIDKSVDSGIPVVTLFSDVPNSKRLTLIGAPERQSAKELAERVLNEEPKFATQNADILISYNKPGETVTDERLAGIKDVIESSKYSHNLHLVQIVSDHGDDAKAAEAIAPVLARDKNIKVIFGLNARSAIGAVTALKEARNSQGISYKPGEVVVTGWDSDADVLKGIEDRWIRATSVLNSTLCTQIAINILDARTLGYLYPVNLQLRELSLPPVPNQILIPETFVDKDNVAGYRRKQ
jgi:inositol transport system substrate-binding protein